MNAEQELQDDIRAVQDISSVSTMLDVICRVTGMGFAAVDGVFHRRGNLLHAQNANLNEM
jgi:hypothetical protein